MNEESSNTVPTDNGYPLGSESTDGKNYPGEDNQFVGRNGYPLDSKPINGANGSPLDSKHDPNGSPLDNSAYDYRAKGRYWYYYKINWDNVLDLFFYYFYNGFGVIYESVFW